MLVRLLRDFLLFKPEDFAAVNRRTGKKTIDGVTPCTIAPGDSLDIDTCPWRCRLCPCGSSPLLTSLILNGCTSSQQTNNRKIHDPLQRGHNIFCFYLTYQNARQTRTLQTGGVLHNCLTGYCSLLLCPRP